MTSWLDEMLYGSFRFVGLFFSGAPVFGTPASDATFFRRGKHTDLRRWPGNNWSLRPRWQILLFRLVGVAAVIAVFLWRWVAVAVIAVVLVALLAYLLWRKPWKNGLTVTTKYNPIPLFDGLRPILGIPDSDTWSDWLGIPDDVDSPQRTKPVFLRLPPGWTQTDPRHEHVSRIVAHHLPGEWTPIWYIEGTVEFHPLPGELPMLPAAGVTAEAVPDRLSSLPSYQPPEIDPLLVQQTPIVIDGDEAQRSRRHRHD